MTDCGPEPLAAVLVQRTGADAGLPAAWDPPPGAPALIELPVLPADAPGRSHGAAIRASDEPATQAGPAPEAARAAAAVDQALQPLLGAVMDGAAVAVQLLGPAVALVPPPPPHPTENNNKNNNTSSSSSKRAAAGGGPSQAWGASPISRNPTAAAAAASPYAQAATTAWSERLAAASAATAATERSASTSPGWALLTAAVERLLAAIRCDHAPSDSFLLRLSSLLFGPEDGSVFDMLAKGRPVQLPTLSLPADGDHDTPPLRLDDLLASASSHTIGSLRALRILGERWSKTLASLRQRRPGLQLRSGAQAVVLVTVERARAGAEAEGGCVTVGHLHFLDVLDTAAVASLPQGGGAAASTSHADAVSAFRLDPDNAAFVQVAAALVTSSTNILLLDDSASSAAFSASLAYATRLCQLARPAPAIESNPRILGYIQELRDINTRLKSKKQPKKEASAMRARRDDLRGRLLHGENAAAAPNADAVSGPAEPAEAWGGSEPAAERRASPATSRPSSSSRPPSSSAVSHATDLQDQEGADDGEVREEDDPSVGPGASVPRELLLALKNRSGGVPATAQRLPNVGPAYVFSGQDLVAWLMAHSADDMDEAAALAQQLLDSRSIFALSVGGSQTSATFQAREDAAYFFKSTSMGFLPPPMPATVQDPFAGRLPPLRTDGSASALPPLSTPLPPISPSSPHSAFYPESTLLASRHLSVSATFETSPLMNLEAFGSTDRIHMAALHGDKASVVRDLVAQCGIENPDHGGRTPLMYAVIGNQPRTCQLLLKLGARVNAIDHAGQSALLWVSSKGYVDVTNILLRAGADVAYADPDGRTALHWCCKLPDPRCLRLLLTCAGPDIANRQDREHLTALHWAVLANHPVHVRYLLHEGHAAANIGDAEGRTALMYAVFNYSPACLKEIVAFCNADVINARDNKGRTALHLACGEGALESVRILLQSNKCLINSQDMRLTTPLHWAVVTNRPSFVHALLDAGASDTVVDAQGLTPQQLAKQRGLQECARLLHAHHRQLKERRGKDDVSVRSSIFARRGRSAPALLPSEAEPNSSGRSRRMKRRESMSARLLCGGSNPAVLE